MCLSICRGPVAFPGSTFRGGAELVPAISEQEHAATRDALQALLVLGWKREGILGNLHSAFLGESVFLEAAVGFFGDGAFENLLR